MVAGRAGRFQAADHLCRGRQADNPYAARRIAHRIRDTAEGLGSLATGRPGRVVGTYEKVVTGLPYIIAYAITGRGRDEAVSILRVIHTARDWPPDAWPR